jgi:hypothetical protein
MQKRPQILTAGLLAGLIAACGTGRDWKMPEFPSDMAELVRFQQAEQAQLARALPEPERFISEERSPSNAALWAAPDRREIGERLERAEQAQEELLSGLSGGAADASADPRGVGAKIAGGLEEQEEELRVLRQRFEAALESGGLSGNQKASPANSEGLRELEAGIERRLIRLADADAEQLTRLAQVEQRSEQLGQALQTPSSRDRRWLFGLAALGLLSLITPWLWLRTKGRAQEQQQEVGLLTQNAARLDARQGHPEDVRPYELPRPSNASRPEAVSAAGAAALALAEAARNAAQGAGQVPAEENLPNFELPRSSPSFEQRKQDQDPKHTPARHLAPFAGQTAEAEEPATGIQPSPSEASASLRRFVAETETAGNTLTNAAGAALVGAEASTATELGTDAPGNREDFELDLVRHLARQRGLREGSSGDRFEEFAARTRPGSLPSAPESPSIERELAWTRRSQPAPEIPADNPRSGASDQPQAATSGDAATSLDPMQPTAAEQGLLERLAKLRPQGSSDTTLKLEDQNAQDNLRVRVIDPPWGSLSPLPAAEQSQARFETELEKAFRALEQERLAHEAELRQALEALEHPASSAEFPASEDEEPRR